MVRLQVAVLGTPAIRHGGEALSFPTRKALALLIYLTVEGGLHSREKLAALFWPDSDERHGRAMLRYTIAVLRRVVRHPAGAQHLVVMRDALGVAPDADFEVDVHLLRAAYTQDPSPATSASPSGAAQTIATLRHLVTLNHGEFLEGFSLPDAPAFDDWAELQREVSRHTTDRVLDRLSQLEADSGEIAGAVETVGRWLAGNPLNEVAYRRLMRLHIAAGDRVGALRAYESCRALLAKELDISPSPETESIAERIRFDESLRPVPLGEPPSPSTVTGFLEGPLVGRSDQFQRWVELYHAAHRGAVQAVILEGEPGIGKTRLARELLGWARGQGADVLQGRAFETGGRLPYQPLVDALRPRLDQENAPDDLLSDVWLAELGRLLPELRDRYPDLPMLLGDEPAARTRLFEAIARLGQALAERAPVVLFVDDLQWSDTGSLDVLHYAGRRWAESRTSLILLFSLRSESTVATPALDEWLVGLRRSLPITRIELDPLTVEDMMRFVRGLGAERLEQGSPPTPELEQFARWLFTETEGQPLFAVELIRVLLERQALIPQPRQDGGWMIHVPPDMADEAALHGILPPGVQEVIRDRLARLGRTARELFTAGAVLGQGFTFDQLCRVAALSEDEALPGIDMLLRAHLLRETESTDRRFIIGSYLFTHDKIREAVYAEAGEARRRIFHRRALEALQAAPAAQRVRHAQAAGLEESAVRLSLAAGDDAMRLLAGRDAIAHYERASDIAERLGWGDMCAELHARCGKAFASVALWGQARHEFEAALNGLGTAQRERRTEILVDLLEACWWLLDLPSLRQAASEALASAKELRRGELETAAMGWLAAAIGADGDVAGCVAGCRQAFARGRELDIPAPPQVHTYVSLSLYWLGQLDEAIERSDAGIEAARAGNQMSAMMWCLPHLGIALAASGRYDEADRAFQEARQLGREYGVDTLRARAIAMSAGFYLDLEEFARHEALAEEARELAHSLSFPPPAVSAGIDLLMNFARRQDVGRAEKLIDEVAASVEATSGFHGWLWKLRLAEARAEIALARGDWDETLAWANQAITQSHARKRVKYHAIALSTRARASLAMGRTKQAIADFRMAVAVARPIGDPALFLRAATGMLAVDGDDALAAEAGAAVDRIVKALQDEGMRRRFEATETVRIVTSLM